MSLEQIVLDIIREAGSNGISRSDLKAKLDGKGRTSSEEEAESRKEGRIGAPTTHTLKSDRMG